MKITLYFQYFMIHWYFLCDIVNAWDTLILGNSLPLKQDLPRSMVSFFFQPQNFSHPRLYDYPPVQEDAQRLHFLILQFTFPPLQKFFAMDFISNCEQIPMLLWICSHLLKRSLMEISFFCNVSTLFSCHYYYRLSTLLLFIT